MPQSMETMVKPATQKMSRRLRPKRAASQPTGAAMMATAAI